MRDPGTGGELFPRIVRHKDWEIPVPGKEAVVGFLVFVPTSGLLHVSLIVLCDWLRGE